MKKQENTVRTTINTFLNNIFREQAIRNGGERWFDRDFCESLPAEAIYKIQIEVVRLAKILDKNEGN